MKKTSVTERDICSKFITPAITAHIPPVTAKRRIAAKVDELMALFGQLGAHYASIALPGAAFKSA